MRKVLRFGDQISRRYNKVFSQPAIHVFADNLVLRADRYVAGATEFTVAAGHQRIKGDGVAGAPTLYL